MENKQATAKKIWLIHTLDNMACGFRVREMKYLECDSVQLWTGEEKSSSYLTSDWDMKYVSGRV